MKSSYHPVQRSVYISTILLATVVFSFICWATWQIFKQPDLGILWSYQGEIYYAKPDSPIEVGDRLVAIDDVPFTQSSFPYYHWRTGDIINLEIEREMERVSLEIVYIEKAPPLVLLTRLSIVTVAFLFWVMGAVVAIFLPVDAKQGLIFFLSCQLTGLALALGNVTGQFWSGQLSILLTWWLAPLLVHFHLLFPVNKIFSWSRPLLLAAYLIPLLASLRLFQVLGFIVLPDGIIAIYPFAFYGWILSGLLIVLFLLVRSYQQASSAAAQSQVGLVVIAAFLALLPLITLSLAPMILWGEPMMPTELTFLFFVAIPVGYGYAIAKYKFIKLERYINRSVTIVLLIVLIGLIYLLFTAALDRLAPVAWSSTPFVDLIAVALLVVVFNPLHRRLQNLVDYLFYGGWYDYRSVVGQVTHTLEKATDVKLLAELLSQSIQVAMRVHWACLLLPDWISGRTVTGAAGQEADTPDLLTDLQIEDINHIISFLGRHAQPTTSREIQDALSSAELSTVEKEILAYESVRLWVPVHGRKNSMGVLILGPKYGGDVFDSLDMGILSVVSRQTGTTFQNAELIAELEQKAQENEKYQKQILYAREQERKRLTRELHDEVIQALVGFRYEIARMLPLSDSEEFDPQFDQRMQQLQQEIGGLIGTTRNLCYDLRPPALDLGLIPSIRSVVSRFEMQGDANVTLLIEGDRAVGVGEDVALCLFRCTSEALSNIYKHASAEKVCIELKVASSSVGLMIEDDGCGFIVPDRLGSLMEQSHFGLMSMRERIELLGGTFEIISEPQRGTRLLACIPVGTGLED